MRGAFHGIRRFFGRVSRGPREVQRDVDAELAFHLEMKVAEFVRLGHAPAEASRLAAEAFGDLRAARQALARDDTSFERTRLRTLWWGELRQDAGHTLRQLRRAPGFAALVTGTLALGIGATTAIFSAVNGILLTPLPYSEPDRLVRAVRQTPDGTRQSASAGDYYEFRRTATTLSGLTSYYLTTGNLVGFGPPQRVSIARVSDNFFDVLGVRPVRGRAFTAAEDTFGAPEVALISEGSWRRLFGADSAVIGRTLRIDRQSVQIIGIVPHEGRYPETAELWLPAKHNPEMIADDNRGASWLRLVGRLAPGTSLTQANAEFATLSNSISARFPEDRAGNTTALAPFADLLIGDVKQPLWVLLGAVGLVLLITCTNVAALLLGRMTARGPELTVRTALGAGRGRISRQLLTESTVLGLLGAAGGVALAMGLVRLLVALAPNIPRLDAVRLNGTVLAFAAALGVLTGLVFGVAPAWHVSRLDLHDRLRSVGRAGGSMATRRATRTRRVLVVGQLALAIVLLVGAGLLLRTFGALRGVDPGFVARDVTTFTVTLPQDGSFDEAYGGIAGQRQFLRSATERLAQIPGVDVVGATFGLPLTAANFTLSFEVEGRPKPPLGQEPEAQIRVATPGYFAAMGIPAVRGRALSADDRAGAPLVFLVSEQFVRRYFPGEEVLGKRLTFGWARDSSELAGEVVGVVRDVKQLSLSADAIPMAFVAADQWPVDELSFALKSRLPVGSLATQAAEAIHSIDPELPLYDVRSAEDLLSMSLGTTRFYLTLLMLFAGLALGLATLGLYGVVSFGVAQRRQELGVRMALGAPSGRLQAMVIGEGLRLLVPGIAVGVAGALSLSGLLRNILYAVRPADPLTIVAVAVLLGAAALVASAIPARRAARIDPQTAMRGE